MLDAPKSSDKHIRCSILTCTYQIAQSLIHMRAQQSPVFNEHTQTHRTPCILQLPSGEALLVGEQSWALAVASKRAQAQVFILLSSQANKTLLSFVVFTHDNLGKAVCVGALRRNRC